MTTWCKTCGLRINGWWNKNYIEGEYCEKHLEENENKIIPEEMKC